MSWTPADLPSLVGTTAIVTGANAGIGFHTARELAAHGASVVLACRNEALATEAANRMTGSVRVEVLDLASQASVHDFAARWDGPLDLLVNNAGVMSPPRYRETVDGHELMFGTNHLGHFALTGMLLPALLAAPAPRVVTVSSLAHHAGAADVVEANPREGYSPHHYYGNSKLANLLFTRELHHRFGHRLTATASHPGVSATNLVSSRDGLGAIPPVRWAAPIVLPLILQSAAAGAHPSLYAATLAEAGSFTGPDGWREFRGAPGPAKLSRHARNDDLARQLWELSVEKTAVGFEG